MSESQAQSGGIDQIVSIASDSLSDQMVERLSTASANVMEVADRLNDDETRDAIHSLLDELTALHRNGGLTALFEGLHFINAIRNAMTDGMVERMAIFAEHMVDNLGSEEVAKLASETADAISVAAQETAQNPPAGGMMSTLRLLSQPETQASLQFLLNVAGKLRSR